jgi:hypothetical protein
MGTMRVDPGELNFRSLKQRRRNGGAVRRREEKNEPWLPSQGISLLPDRLVYPSPVRDASDLHGSSEHSRTSVA